MIREAFVALFARFSPNGGVPLALQFLVSVSGVLIIGVAVAVFVRQAWNAEVSEATIVYTSVMLLVGLALVRSAAAASRPHPTTEKESKHVEHDGP